MSSDEDDKLDRMYSIGYQDGFVFGAIAGMFATAIISIVWVVI